MDVILTLQLKFGRLCLVDCFSVAALSLALNLVWLDRLFVLWDEQHSSSPRPLLNQGHHRLLPEGGSREDGAAANRAPPT